MYRFLAVVLPLLSFAGVACTGSRVSGRYTHRANPVEVLELRPDGTLVLETGAARLTGAYVVDGDRLTITPQGAPPIKGVLRGLALVAEDGHTWVRKWPAGHYAHATRPEVYVDLWPDGSFHYAKGENDHRGHYDVEGASLRLWYPSDGRCTRGGAGPAVPSPGECAFLAEVKGDAFTFFRLSTEAGHELREPGEELLLRPPPSPQ